MFKFFILMSSKKDLSSLVSSKSSSVSRSKKKKSPLPQPVNKYSPFVSVVDGRPTIKVPMGHGYFLTVVSPKKVSTVNDSEVKDKTSSSDPILLNNQSETTFVKPKKPRVKPKKPRVKPKKPRVKPKPKKKNPVDDEDLEGEEEGMPEEGDYDEE
jgi:hypothetical protein